MSAHEPQLVELLDQEVINRVLSGETALFEIIMRRYNQRLFRIARSILRDDHEAEDVVQETYVRAYLHLGQFEGRSAFATWLTKIAIYEAQARAKRKDKFESIGGQEENGFVARELRSSTPDPEKEALTREVRKLLEAAIDNLPESYRAVFMMREIEGMTTAETAECLEITEEAAKMRLHRAREMVRAELYERLGASSNVFEFRGESCDRLVRSVFQRIRSLQ